MNILDLRGSRVNDGCRYQSSVDLIGLSLSAFDLHLLGSLHLLASLNSLGTVFANDWLDFMTLFLNWLWFWLNWFLPWFNNSFVYFGDLSAVPTSLVETLGLVQRFHKLRSYWGFLSLLDESGVFVVNVDFVVSILLDILIVIGRFKVLGCVNFPVWQIILGHCKHYEF